MKVDFRKVELKDIEGNIENYDLSKELGNAIYKKTADLGELDLAQRIYKQGEVEIDDAEKEVIKRYVKENFLAFVQLAVNEMLEQK